MQCFSQHGFLKTTLGDIAKAMNLRKASLYYYYESKEAILSDVVAHEGAAYLTRVQAELLKEKTATRKILRLVKVRLDHFLKAMSLHKLSVPMFFEVKPVINGFYKNFRQQEAALLRQVIQNAVKSGEFKACNAEKVAEAVLTLTDAVELKGYQVAHARGDLTVDVHEIETEAAFMAMLLFNGIKA